VLERFAVTVNQMFHVLSSLVAFITVNLYQDKTLDFPLSTFHFYLFT